MMIVYKTVFTVYTPVIHFKTYHNNYKNDHKIKKNFFFQ